MSLIYVRHGDKLHHNNSRGVSHAYDCSLSRTDLKEIYERVKLLVESYGSPKYIICSPFERCRETAILFRFFLNDILGEAIITHETTQEELRRMTDNVRDTIMDYDDDTKPPSSSTETQEVPITSSEQIKIQVDRYIGEYFGNLDLVDTSHIREETLCHSIFIDRNRKGLEQRVHRHLRHMSRNFSENDIVWLITHGSVATTIASKTGSVEGTVVRGKLNTLGYVYVPLASLC